MSTFIVRLDRAASTLIVWTIALCLVGVLTLAAVVVIVPLHYREKLRGRWTARGLHRIRPGVSRARRQKGNTV